MPASDERESSGRRSFGLAVSVLVGVVVGVSVYVLALSGSGAIGASGPITGDLAASQTGERGVRVLFIGNSFTAANGMTTMVKRLAAQAPGTTCPVFVVQYAVGGATLSDASADRRVPQLIASRRFNAVVMQDQSQIPSLPYWLAVKTVPSAVRLAGISRSIGAVPILFETWGYRHGDALNFGPSDTFTAMQDRLDAGYAQAGQQSDSLVAPVGDVWARALAADPSLDLWSSDDKHPNVAGSYLAAVTFWREIATDARAPGCVIGTSSSSYTAGLDRTQADFLQRVSAGVAPPGA